MTDKIEPDSRGSELESTLKAMTASETHRAILLAYKDDIATYVERLATQRAIEELEEPLYFNLSEHSHEQFKAGYEQALDDWERYRLIRIRELRATLQGAAE